MMLTKMHVLFSVFDIRYSDTFLKFVVRYTISILSISVAEPHHFYAAPGPGKNFDAAPAPTLVYCKAKLYKSTKVKTNVETILCI
jgi:hypothetical protein